MCCIASGIGQAIADRELQIMNCGLRIADCGLAEHELRIANCEFCSISSLSPRPIRQAIADCELRNLLLFRRSARTKRLRIADFALFSPLCQIQSEIRNPQLILVAALPKPIRNPQSEIRNH
jgi:hypothetical protein